MITVKGRDDKEYRCTSSDEKPTTGVANGAALLEIDTGDVYLFDKEAGTWHKM